MKKQADIEREIEELEAYSDALRSFVEEAVGLLQKIQMVAIVPASTTQTIHKYLEETHQFLYPDEGENA